MDMTICVNTIQQLGIADRFLSDHIHDIVARLGTAETCISSRPRNPLDLHKMHAINQCLHLAGSLVLLGSDSDKLKETLERLHPADDPPTRSGVRGSLPNSDPTTYLSVAMLCYLLADYLPRQKAIELRKRNSLWSALDSANWIIGIEDMKLLGIPSTPTPPSVRSVHAAQKK